MIQHAPAEEDDCSGSVRTAGCIVSAVACVPFGFFSGLLFIMAWGWGENLWEFAPLILKLAAGWVYLIGSMVWFSGRMSPGSRITAALLLNAAGACLWVPMLFSREKGSLWFAGTGIILTALWLLWIFCGRRNPPAGS